MAHELYPSRSVVPLREALNLLRQVNGAPLPVVAQGRVEGILRVVLTLHVGLPPERSHILIEEMIIGK